MRAWFATIEHPAERSGGPYLGEAPTTSDPYRVKVVPPVRSPGRSGVSPGQQALFRLVVYRNDVLRGVEVSRVSPFDHAYRVGHRCRRTSRRHRLRTEVADSSPRPGSATCKAVACFAFDSLISLVSLLLVPHLILDVARPSPLRRGVVPTRSPRHASCRGHL